MRLILQFCLLLLVLLGAEPRAWGKVDVGQNIASGGLPLFLVDCTDGDAPPALITQGEPGPWDYEPAPDVCNGPNLYAYVKQNPWTSFDPDGLALETVWDVLNIAHDVGRLVKNGAEMGWGAAKTGYHKVSGNEEAANASWNGIDGDWGEFKQAAGDTAIDAGAALIPGLPAGIQKSVRTGLNVYEKAEQAEAAANTAEKLAEGDYAGAANPTNVGKRLR